MAGVKVMRAPAPAVAALAFSTLCHATVFLQWRLLFPSLFPYEGFRDFFLATLVLSWLLSISMTVVSGLTAFRLLLLLRGAIFVALVRPFGTYLYVDLVLLCSTILEISAYEDYPANLILDASAIGLSLLHKGRILVADIGPMVIRDVLVYVVATSGLAYAASLLTRHRQQLIACRSEAARLRRAADELSTISQSYLQMVQVAEERSTRKERNRITRELHDTVGYTLTNLIMMMEAAKALVAADPPRLHATLDEACRQAQHGLAETRRSLHQLREQDARRPVGLAAIHSLVKTFEQATSIPVEVVHANVPFTCGHPIDAFMYRFVQEGLTNSFRHGKATRIRIRLWKDDDTVSLHLWDNGVGATVIKEGIGLLGMRERLGKIGGTLEARNVIDGFELFATIPTKE